MCQQALVAAAKQPQVDEKRERPLGKVILRDRDAASNVRSEGVQWLTSVKKYTISCDPAQKNGG